MTKFICYGHQQHIALDCDRGRRLVGVTSGGRYCKDVGENAAVASDRGSSGAGVDVVASELSVRCTATD